MNTSSDHTAIHTLFEVLKCLPAKRQKRFWVLLAGMVIVAGLETLSAGIIALYASSVTDPSIILESHIPRMQAFSPIELPSTFRGLITMLSVTVVCVLAVKNIVQALVSYASKLYASNISGFLGEKLLSGFLALPYEWHTARNPADLIQAITWRQYFNNLLTSFLKTLSDCLIVVIMLGTLLVVEPKISLLVIATVGGAAIGIFSKVRHTLDDTAKKHRTLNQSINLQASRALHGVKDIKVYGKEKAFVREYDQEVRIFARIEANLQILRQCPMWILETLGFAMLCGAICIMFFVTENSTAKVTGIISLLAVTAWRVLPAMVRILEGMTTIRQALPYVRTELDYMDEIDKKASESNDFPETAFSRKLILEDVSFAYETSKKDVLNDIDMSVLKGETVGIIGTSGSGKSTLVDILIGLLSPQTGRIFVDKSEIDISSGKTWTQKIGYVPQTPYIFDGTLAENIAFGIRRSEIDTARVLECCRMAAMDDFLDNLSDGLETILGERGIRLSGGQRQRVAIARALYRRPEIIIFDEATSALDEKNERTIQETIYSLKEKMTLIIIAHRLSTVEDCDRIVWLEDGRVEMAGDPDQVLGRYRSRHSESGGSE